MEQSPQLITRKSAPPTVGVIRHVDNLKGSFDPACFSIDELESRGIVQGAASAGRGNTVFFTLNGDALVLRHYRRGGLIRHISRSHYVFTGFNRTRALREFDLLIRLQEAGLPAPRAYACQVIRKGLFYTASLVTYRLPGMTLAQALEQLFEQSTEQSIAPTEADSSPPCLSEAVWRAIGAVIAQFHVAGIDHADLNAHNIMIDESLRVSLIDFDRGVQRALPSDPAQSGWCLANMNRLERSINKIANVQPLDSSTIDTIKRNFQICKIQWSEAVNS